MDFFAITLGRKEKGQHSEHVELGILMKYPEAMSTL